MRVLRRSRPCRRRPGARLAVGRGVLGDRPPPGEARAGDGVLAELRGLRDGDRGAGGVRARGHRPCAVRLARRCVRRSLRGKGLGTAFVGLVRDHLAPLGLRRLALVTEDAHGVYEKLGFRPLDRPERWMVHTFGRTAGE
ncbi:GNAT family N-acetyltransferase [Streptomyces sp. NPDC053086]|uniref:GNAT family N-acetyltransferase n=1 Tax=unclassified Streptomyces TaxID=2593676 RepID=UPI0037CD9258